MQWAKDYWLALHPYSAGGGYVNMMMDEGEDSVKSGLPRQLRAPGPGEAKYDPDNLFHVNQNIKPA